MDPAIGGVNQEGWDLGDSGTKHRKSLSAMKSVMVLREFYTVS